MSNPFIVQLPAQVGDIVEVKWTVDDRHGGGQLVKVGLVKEIDDWLRIGGTNKQPGELHLPVSYFDEINLIPKDNPFMVS